MMPPILRSVVTECNRRGGWRSTGCRSFSSSPPGSRTSESNGKGGIAVPLIVKRGLSLAFGFGVGVYEMGNPVAKYEKERQEIKEKFHQLMDEREEAWSKVLPYRMMSPASFVSDDREC